jgi:hypothetical protein
MLSWGGLSFDSIVQIVSIILAVLGISPTLAIFWNRLQEIRPSRRLLGLSKRRRLDIVVTTSAFSQSAVGAPVSRPVTGIGQLKSVGIVARALGRLFPNISLSVQLSEAVEHRPGEDMILLGGPSKNSFAARFLSALGEATGNVLVFDDANQTVRLDGYSFDKVEIQSGLEMPKREAALAVCWHNPVSHDRQSRGILCCGLTTYGTVASTEWLFDDLLAKKPIGKVLLKGKYVKMPRNFIAIIEVTYSGSQFAQFTVAAVHRL